MTWLIIGVILLAAFGPVLWLMPSKRDQLLSGLREQARRDGLVVALRDLPKLDPAPEDRVSAGGKLRRPVVECMAYSWMLAARLKMSGGWRLRRYIGDYEGVGDGVTDGVERGPDSLPGGWIVEPDMEASASGARSQLAMAVGAVRELVAQLPEDVIGLEVTPTSVGVFWLEKAGSTKATVTQLSSLLVRFGEQIAALDRRMFDELGPDDS